MSGNVRAVIELEYDDNGWIGERAISIMRRDGFQGDNGDSVRLAGVLADCLTDAIPQDCRNRFVAAVILELASKCWNHGENKNEPYRALYGSGMDVICDAARAFALQEAVGSCEGDKPHRNFLYYLRHFIEAQDNTKKET
jgi:hypothetical protein